MTQLAVILIALAALIGITMAVQHFRGRTPPSPALAILHGLLAVPPTWRDATWAADRDLWAFRLAGMLHMFPPSQYRTAVPTRAPLWSSWTARMPSQKLPNTSQGVPA